MSLLLIDAGNSRVKWGVRNGAGWQQRGVVEHSDDALERSLAGLPVPRRVIVSNVAGERAGQQIRAACGRWNAVPEFIVAQQEQCGVRNGYTLPAQLGSDRWAALIAAWHHGNAACLVVNCGTATTVDVLSAQGVFVGGVILPGIDLMLHSLAGRTAQLESAAGSWNDFPCNTADGMLTGALRATTGAIRGMYGALGVAGAACLLTGGAADRVVAHLDLPVVQLDDLVLQGLSIIGQES